MQWYQMALYSDFCFVLKCILQLHVTDPHFHWGPAIMPVVASVCGQAVTDEPGPSGLSSDGP